MNVGKVIGGCAAIAFGLLLIVFARPISSAMSGAQKAFLGKLGDEVAQHTTPRTARYVGTCGILLGCFLVITSF